MAASFPENHTKPMNAHSGQNSDLLSLKTYGKYSYKQFLKS
jgi:hypothetical protein